MYLAAMYTVRVLRRRLAALVLALIFVATPVLAVACEMDCGQPPAVSACHESTDSGGVTLRAGQHPCDHDLTSQTPAFISEASVRDSVAIFVTASALLLAPIAGRDASIAAAVHEPPDLSTRRRTPARTILRI
jgi:hypothetical protein